MKSINKEPYVARISNLDSGNEEPHSRSPPARGLKSIKEEDEDSARNKAQSALSKRELIQIEQRIKKQVQNKKKNELSKLKTQALLKQKTHKQNNSALRIQRFYRGYSFRTYQLPTLV